MIFMLTMAIGTSIIGCGANSDNTASETAISSTQEPSTEPSSIEGIWGSNSISGENDNFPATYYVQFTDSTIDYGHMTNSGEFEVDFSNKISAIIEVSPGVFCVQAKTDDGRPYTYQTNEDDHSIMDYYSTWDKNEYDSNYSASDSISKLKKALSKIIP